jgi:hypothetical protein
MSVDSLSANIDRTCRINKATSDIVASDGHVNRLSESNPAFRRRGTWNHTEYIP